MRKGIMKAYPFDEGRLNRWNVDHFYVQPKFNGLRCRGVPNTEGGITLLSSEENEFTVLPHINAALKEIADVVGASFEFDGELYKHGWPLEQISSAAKRNTPSMLSAVIEYHIFDVIAPLSQQNRLAVLDTLKMMIEDKPTPLSISPTHIADDLSSTMDILDLYYSQGYEGIIIRHPKAFYVRKRSIYMMKFKPKQSDLYPIIGVKEEIDKNGRPKNALGALVCQSDDGELFAIGSGFTRDQRNYYWQNKHLLKGKLCHVEFQHSQRSKPMFGVFVRIIDPITRETF